MDDKKDRDDLMQKIVSLCKRRGFVFPGSEIYGGFAGFYDWGPLGLSLKNNLKDLWWKVFVNEREDIFGIDSEIIMNPQVWRTSGHVSGFTDPLETGERFNVMFKTSAGAGDEAVETFLRPETAQGIFINFKNIIDAFHPRIPFGIAQIGKAFRNEISPREFLFRKREFEQMELEYFVRPDDWEHSFEDWRGLMKKFASRIGLNGIHELEVPENDRAHYSKRTIDFEFDFPFGRRELWGLAYRTDYDLGKHSEASGVSLEYTDEETKQSFIPHCIEPSLGVDRTILALLVSAYSEDKLGGEDRVYLKFKPEIAPVKIAVFPLLRNKPELVEKARGIYQKIRKEMGTAAVFDANGNIGKRYRRQDEIGTPFCVTIDFQTLEDDTVTIRDRDTGEQQRTLSGEILQFTKLG